MTKRLEIRITMTSDHGVDLVSLFAIEVEFHRGFPEVKGWLDEDLDNYHLKELRCSTQCHTQMSMWIISRGVVLLILLMEYKVLRDFLLHRSSINNSASLSNKFGGFHFIFKFGISGLLHQVITTIADRIRDKDTSQSKQNLQSSSMTFIHKTLIIPSFLDSCFISSTVSEDKRAMLCLDFKILKTLKIQAGVQVSRPGELRRHLQLWKRFGRLYYYDNPDPAPELQNVSPSADTTVPSQQELDLLFGPLYDEFFNDGTSRVNKSSSPTDNSIQKDTLPSTHIQPTSEPITPTNVHAEENNDNQAEFTNPFCTSVQENVESSSHNIGNSNVHTFNQPQDSEYRWTKDHPLTQVHGDPSKPVQTRRQLATDPEMYMFVLTVSIVELKNIKDAMADSAWIEEMQEEIH
ncbi:hypothetical protein Tco_1194980 [Tanacetum coccineum]